MVKIFAIGTSGWVGSQSAYTIATAHPEYEWTALLRTQSKADIVSKFLPKTTRYVFGDFDSYDLLVSEAAAADIVYNWASSDHDALNQCLLDGLKKKTTSCYLIHTSGTGVLAWESMSTKAWGAESTKLFDDWEGLGDVISLPDQAMHMNVDRVVLNVHSEAPHIRTAIVCPPVIYGKSDIAEVSEHSALRSGVTAILKRGKGFYVGEGKARWNTVHIKDLARAFLLLTEQAVQSGGIATWGPEGYYFVESGDLQWLDFAQTISRVAFEKGLIDSSDVDSLSIEEAQKIDQFGPIVWATNSRSKAVRAKKLLGWEPVEVGALEDTVDNWRWKADDVRIFG